MIDILICIATGIVFAQRGSGMVRALWCVFTVALCFAVQPDYITAALYAIAFICLGTFPTNGLMSATHGDLPKRADYWAFQWIQWSSSFAKGKTYGIVYGFYRGLTPAVFALYTLNLPLVFVCYTHGAIYYIAGRLYPAKAVRLAEFMMGFFIMLAILKG